MNRGPLDDMDDVTLYKLLGEAWYAQSPEGRDDKLRGISSSLDVGIREFTGISEILREALRQPYFQGVSARVSSTLQFSATWQMPTMVVLALARHHGMVTRTRLVIN